MIRCLGIARGDEAGEEPKVYERRCSDFALVCMGTLGNTVCSIFVAFFTCGIRVLFLVLNFFFFLMVLVLSRKFSVLMCLPPVFYSVPCIRPSLLLLFSVFAVVSERVRRYTSGVNCQKASAATSTLKMRDFISIPTHPALRPFNSRPAA